MFLSQVYQPKWKQNKQKIKNVITNHMQNTGIK